MQFSNETLLDLVTCRQPDSSHCAIALLLSTWTLRNRMSLES